MIMFKSLYRTSLLLIALTSGSYASVSEKVASEERSGNDDTLGVAQPGQPRELGQHDNL